MIPKQAIVTGVLLAVAVLAFSGLAYQTVPMSTTQTMTQESTRELGVGILNTATITYVETVTSSITESSTNTVPASEALGLTNGSFTALAVVVIGILALLTAWVTLKSRITDRPKQATVSQFVKARLSCIKCDAELPPASEFCNKCGTKQTA